MVKEVADIVVKTLRLKNVKYVYKPLLHGVGWLGDVKKIALDITKLKELEFKPRMNSSTAVRYAAEQVANEP